MGSKVQENIVLRSRKGFARVAVEQGVDGIIPVYHFGSCKVGVNQAQQANS